MLLTITNDDFKKIGEIVDKRLASTEKRLEKRITSIKSELKVKIDSSAKSVMRDIGQFVEDQLIPIIEEKADKSDIDRLERKLDNFAVKVTEHDKRLDDIEALPIIAHQLKSQK